nr:Mov34/MPN/PAD-1 family protein [Escherichia coli]
MTETESAILAHARRCAPAESCGFVVRTPEGERYFPCVNTGQCSSEVCFRSEDIRDERESVGDQRRILKNGCRIVRQFGGVIGIIGVCFKR